MARGIDSSSDSRRSVSKAAEMGIVGAPRPGMKVGQLIARETREQQYEFGTVLGPQDSGMRTGAERVAQAQPEISNAKPKIVWNQMAAPVGGDLEGAPADVIRLTQMRENRRRAMPYLMEEAPVRHVDTKLVDPREGRLLSSQRFPVREYVDERIKAVADPEKVARADRFRAQWDEKLKNRAHQRRRPVD